MKLRVLWLAMPLAALTLASCGGSGNSGAFFVRVWGSSDPGIVNGGPTVARFSNPVNVVTGIDGTAYVADFDNNVVRAISPSGDVSTLTSQANFGFPFGMAVTKTGVLYVETDSDDTGAKDGNTGTVWRINLSTGAATVVARDIGRPRGLTALADGTLAFSDLTNNVVSLLNPTTGAVTPLAGSHGVAGFVNGHGTAAQFNRPYGLTLWTDGSLLVADQTNNCIRRVTMAGDVTTFAGNGTAGNLNGLLSAATFNGPQSVVSAPDGTIYVADTSNHTIRRISGNEVRTEAGNGNPGFADGTGAGAEFFGLEGFGINKEGTILWIADGNGGNGDPYNRVRRLQVP